MDLFSLALGDENTGRCLEQSASSPYASAVAHSQECAGVNDDIEDLTMLDVEHALADASEKSCNAALTTPIKDRPQMRSNTRRPVQLERKRSSLDLTAENKRRRAKDTFLSMSPLGSDASFIMPIVFVEHENNKVGEVPIPLWNMYRATWGETNFGGAVWICVAPTEHWVTRLVDSQTKKNTREVCSKLCALMRKELNNCLEVKRAPHIVCDDLFGDSKVVAKKRKVEVGAMDVILGEYPLTIVNTSTKCLLKCDENTKKFVRMWLTPLVKVVALSQDSSNDSQDGSQDATVQLAPFHMSVNATPNVREKVSWEPLNHMWKLILNMPKAAPPKFHVDPRLDAAAYDQEKVKLYWQAIDTWNALDGSKRHRIVSTRLSGQ